VAIGLGKSHSFRRRSPFLRAVTWGLKSPPPKESQHVGRGGKESIGSIVPPGLYSCLLRAQDFVLGYVRRRPVRDSGAFLATLGLGRAKARPYNGDVRRKSSHARTARGCAANSRLVGFRNWIRVRLHAGKPLGAPEQNFAAKLFHNLVALPLIQRAAHGKRCDASCAC